MTVSHELGREGRAKPIVDEPGSLFVASIASRSEIPSGPGAAISPATVATSPFAASELVETVMTTAAGAAAEGATRRTRRTPTRTIFVRRSITKDGPSSALGSSGAGYEPATQALVVAIEPKCDKENLFGAK